MANMYEVTSNYGGAVIEGLENAINTLWLLAPYHNKEIDCDKVKKALEKEGYYEDFPLSVQQGYKEK